LNFALSTFRIAVALSRTFYMTQSKTAVDVQSEVEARLKKPVDEAIWAYLEEKFFISEVLAAQDRIDEKRELDGLVTEYRRLEQVRGTGQRRATVRVREEVPDKRWEALARIIAIQANRLPQVRQFRRSVLGDRLLRPEEIEDWIKSRARSDERVIWIRVAEPLGNSLDFEHPLRPSKSAMLAYLADALDTMGWSDFKSETLGYAYPGHGRIRGEAVAQISDVVQVSRGPLLLLKDAAEDLTDRYPWWDERQTVAFVLTGKAPRYSPAQASYEANKIVLQVDPRFPGKKFAAFYAQVRRRLHPMRKGKPMKDWRLELAVFNAENLGQSWAWKMNKWNSLHPKLKYSDRRLFARDASDAYTRVMAGLQDPAF
jgi:hypothetical protein